MDAIRKFGYKQGEMLPVFLAGLLGAVRLFNVWWLARGNAANLSLPFYWAAIRPLQILTINRRKCCFFFQCLVTSRRKCCPYYSKICWDAIRPFQNLVTNRGNAARFSCRVIRSSAFQCLVTSRRKCCHFFSPNLLGCSPASPNFGFKQEEMLLVFLCFSRFFRDKQEEMLPILLQYLIGMQSDLCPFFSQGYRNLTFQWTFGD